jgi:pyruvate kinase
MLQAKNQAWYYKSISFTLRLKNSYNGLMKRDASKFKKTKIIATIGPASEDMIHELLAAGVNGVRLNFSHGTHDEHRAKLKAARAAAQELGRSVAVIQDLAGPKIRLGTLPKQGIQIRKGEQLHLSYQTSYDELCILPTQYDFSDDVAIGEHIYLRDGQIKTVVSKVAGGIVSVKALNSGQVLSNHGINLPDTVLKGSILTPKDRQDIAFALHEDVDYVALSFVQSADSIHALRKLLVRGKSRAKIITKIETKPAVRNLREIIAASDAVMIARGDLGVEVGAENVPIVGRQIIELAKQAKKPVIMATQMLESMMTSTEPSRAEANDVSTAVLLGVDSVMLSGETAIGQFPLETVQMMKKIILKAEEYAHSPMRNAEFLLEDDQIHSARNFLPSSTDSVQQRYRIVFERESSNPPIRNANEIQTSIALAAISLTEQLSAKLILAETLSGATARCISSLRPNTPIIMATPDPKIYNQLAIVWGGKSFLVPGQKQISELILEELRKRGNVKKGDLIVSAFGTTHGVTGGTDTIRLLQA